MITEILTERQEALRAEERELLAELADALRRLDDPAAERVRSDARELEELFLVSVTGAPAPAVESLARSLVADPPPPELTVVVPREGEPGPPGRSADLALFLTSAHRPLPPAEHAALRAAAEGPRRLLVVVDEAEMLRLSEDLGRMEEAVEVEAERLLGRRPPGYLTVQMVATARAGGVTAPADSLVPALATRVVGVLRSPDVLRPKLLRPVDAALEVARERRAAVEAGLTSLGDDLANLEVVEGAVESLRETAEPALREAEEEAGRAVDHLGERGGHLVRRASRPFPSGRSVRRRLEDEAVAELRDRLRRTGTRLEERIVAAAGAARQAVEERVTSFPTERMRASRPGAPDGGEASAPLPAPGAGPVVAELELAGHGRWDREAFRSLAADLRRTSVVSLVLLLVGLALVAVPALFAATGGTGVLGVALGGGLGGASILAALANLTMARRRLTYDLSVRIDDLRAAAAAALAAGAERAVGEGGAAVRAPVARYAYAVATERERLSAARSTLERLSGRLEDLRRRVAAA